ncbi:poly-gamma-glutamate biosynthesis protein PgsC [Aeoliella sp. ICT_H6.2]|uniref:Poly-gamma-glutamate biosynthesis protein PgsC n=2 Tax=Aeoliella straminimaris TaxID=2954799 RepID=A0A9X2FCA5_9BACT|nr:poly-gamma-glutamate biosynthesis protein PgsC [Aeoliella straminimaris]
MLSVAIGIGLAVSLLFSELFGLAAGGMVVPGYFALALSRPIDVALTILAALATYMIVYLMSTFIIVYGRRRTVLMILVGYLVRMLFNYIPMDFITSVERYASEQTQFQVIGYIIPGLIAIWFDRQGWLETLCALLTAAVAIRLILILLYGVQLNMY